MDSDNTKYKNEPFLKDVDNYLNNFKEQYYWLDSIFMKKYFSFGKDFSMDYLVQLLNYDKVERLPRTITTSKVTINEPFFNYLIMEFTIVQIPKVAFDETIEDFNYIYPNNFIQFDSEKRYEEEIHLIKRYVPLSERPKYFK